MSRSNCWSPRTPMMSRHRVVMFSALIGIVLSGAPLMAQTTSASAADTVRRYESAVWTVPANAYYPPAGSAWERRAPTAAGFDPQRLSDAIAFAVANESSAPRNLELAHYQSFGREPFGEAIGPFATRGDPTGLIIRNGYIVAEWGDPDRVDMTFSVSKSFLSTTVGVAVDRGLIASVHDTVAQYVGPIVSRFPGKRGLAADWPSRDGMLAPFSSAHNATISWDHLLRQVSDWEGTLWGKPEWSDRPDADVSTWLTRARRAPGSMYEYNDVRVNVLALAATNVWRLPLPVVLREHIMDPIGASRTWRWMGYDDSKILLDGHDVEVVSGGGHWGGGMFISARDQARFGLLTLRRGRWNNRQLLSEAWVRQALTPTPAQPTYGYMNWFLNTEGKYLASATPRTFAHVGNGTNIIIGIPEHDIVIVARWIANGSVDGLVQRVLAAVTR
jgi:CubicO group peptidase (beta-lactamase class C family)